MSRRPNIFDIVPSAERQLKAHVVAWVECPSENTEICIAKAKGKTPWPYIVATYKNEFDSFIERRSFNSIAAAWIHWTAKVELTCLASEEPVFQQRQPTPPKRK
jgi:hypothetical protein